MGEMSESYGESANDTKIEEYLEESLISQDDYKKLKQENECYRQELYVLRLKLEASDAIKRDLQEFNETLEENFKQYMTTVEATRTSTAEKYTASKEEYENHIADLETNIVKNEEEIKELQKEVKKYKDQSFSSKEPCYQIATEETLAPYKEKIATLTTLLQNEEKNVEELKDKLVHVEELNQNLDNNFHMILERLKEKEKALENAQESARELAANLMELEQSKVAPASDTCKGNSLFAEVEDRRQMLLDKMKVLTNKYNDAKRALNTKMAEVKLLRAEKTAMAQKWEIDVIDTLQENADLLNEYKKRTFELETKLRTEIKKNNQMDEIQLTDDSFNYAQSLLVAKREEIKKLNEKIEKQAMQMLMLEEASHNTSRQLRYWRSKAMSLEAQIEAIKAQLETEQTNDNKVLLEAIENCKISGNVNFEKTYDDSKLTPDKLTSENNICQGNSMETSKKAITDSTKEFKRFVCFAGDTKDTESKPLKKQAKQCDYPVVCYTEDDICSFS